MKNNELEKARDARNAYYRAWRAKNPERVRENNLRYWARRAEREMAESECKEVQYERNED